MSPASTTSPRSSRPWTAGADDVVDRLTAGLETQLGPTWPEGVEVSFGQWQKLAPARGFMRDRPLLLVLDEPTAALDAETEHALFERYAAAARGGRSNGAADRADGRITILVSHRFSTVRMADLIVVLDGSARRRGGLPRRARVEGRPVRGALRHPGGGVSMRSECKILEGIRLARRVQVPDRRPPPSNGSRSAVARMSPSGR